MLRTGSHIVRIQPSRRRTLSRYYPHTTPRKVSRLASFAPGSGPNATCFTRQCLRETCIIHIPLKASRNLEGILPFFSLFQAKIGEVPLSEVGWSVEGGYNKSVSQYRSLTTRQGEGNREAAGQLTPLYNHGSHSVRGSYTATKEGYPPAKKENKKGGRGIKIPMHLQFFVPPPRPV